MTVILLHPTLLLVGVSMETIRGSASRMAVWPTARTAAAPGLQHSATAAAMRAASSVAVVISCDGRRRGV